MNFINHLHTQLETYHLLSHPFYQLWNKGELEIDTLKVYAKEYYHHVAAFPRYISGIHTKCDALKTRQILLDNLVDEEQGDENHPELWIRFAEGLGLIRDQISEKPEIETTQNLVDGFFDCVNSDFSSGLGALYAYERQTPEVSHSKIQGLQNHYGITDERTLKFFTVHAGADVWHREECAKIIENLAPVEQEKVRDGALKGAKLLWGFLDGLMQVQDHYKKAA